jgi:hypothetical protein
MRISSSGSKTFLSHYRGYQVCPNLIELNEAIDRAQQMLLRHMPFERKLVEQRVLLDLPLPIIDCAPAVVTCETRAIIP